MSLSLKILGANAAAPAHNRNQTCQVLDIQGLTFMIDCGEGAQIQLKKYKVKHTNISRIFISHLHGDHYYGLMGVISSMHLYGRKAILHLHGPSGLADIVSIQLRHSGSNLNFVIEFHEWTPDTSEILFENESVVVRGIPLRHRIPCMGFLFQEKTKKRRINKEMLTQNIPPVHLNKLKEGMDVLDDSGKVRFSVDKYTLPPRPSLSYAYCSDTIFDRTIVPAIKDVDLLYHEATFTEECKERAAATYHATASQAATIAKDANVGKLIIGHFSNRYKDLTPLLEEAQKVFPQVALAIEGETFTIED